MSLRNDIWSILSSGQCHSRCMDNPEDRLATVNALVSGLRRTLRDIIREAVDTAVDCDLHEMKRLRYVVEYTKDVIREE